MSTQFQWHFIIVKCLNMHENFFYSRMTLPDWTGALKSSFWRVLMPFHRFWKGDINHGIFNGRRFWTWWAVWRAVLSPVARLSNQRDVCLQRDSRRRGPARRHPGVPGWRNVEGSQIDAFGLLANVQGKGDSLCRELLLDPWNPWLLAFILPKGKALYETISVILFDCIRLSQQTSLPKEFCDNLW